MNTKIQNVALFTLLMVAGAAQAQTGAVQVSGFTHSPVGGAVLGPPEGRRLPVHNLGSSGQDGVEIQMNSRLGVGASIETGSLPVGSTSRTKYKGWDGTIKGRCDLTMQSGGWARMTCAYQGATELHCELFNAAGVSVGSGVLGTGGILGYLNNQCPGGGTPVWTCVHHVGPNGVEYATMELLCDSLVNFNGLDYQARTIQITPIFPAGSPPLDVASMVVNSTAPSIVVRDVHLSSAVWGSTHSAPKFASDAECSGLGSALVQDVCDSPVGCTQAERKLRAGNLGSSGNDGVEIKWTRACASVDCDVSSIGGGGTVSGTQMTTAAMSKATWDLKKNVKCRTMPSASGFGQIDFDMSELPGTMLTITATAGGVVTGSTTGDPVGQKIFLDQWWFMLHPFSNQTWRSDSVRFGGLDTDGEPAVVYLFDGVAFHPVLADSITVQFTGGDLPESLSSLQFTGAGMPSGQIEVGNVTASEFVPTCPGDFNHDGSVDFFDYLDFVDAFSSGLASGDFNHDGSIDFFDYLDFVDAFTIGC